MKIDSYLKVVLTIIAVCLVLLVMKIYLPADNAQAASTSTSQSTLQIKVQEVKNIAIKDLKNVIVLDNQRTFIAVYEDGLTVYRLEAVEK